MPKEIAMDDLEIAALLDELEAEQTKMNASAPKPEPELKGSNDKQDIVKQMSATPVPAPAPAPEPAPVAEPEPEPVAEPKPVKAPAPKKPKVVEPEPEPAAVVEEKPNEETIAAMAEAREMARGTRPGADVDIEVSRDVPETSEKAPGQKLSFYVDVMAFNRDTKLTEATLDSAMMEQSGLRAYYGTQAAQAEAQHARLKVRFEVLEAKLYDEHRKLAAASGEKVTEKMVENAVKLDPRWLKGKNTVIEADTIAAINKSLVISLADRKDMMVQLGADRREEFKGGVRIMAAQDERESIAERAKAAFKNGRGIQ